MAWVGDFHATDVEGVVREELVDRAVWAPYRFSTTACRKPSRAVVEITRTMAATRLSL